MASTYYTPIKPVANIDGERADASDVNSISNAVEAAFELLEAATTGLDASAAASASAASDSASAAAASQASATASAIAAAESAAGVDLVGHLADYDHALLNTMSISNVGTGTQETTIGYLSGSALTSGVGNTFYGYQTGTRIDSQNLNTFVGYGAGQTSYCVAAVMIGASTGSYDCTGAYNIFLGYGCGTAVSSGYANVLLGASILNQSPGVGKLTGDFNVFAGYQCCWKFGGNSENNVIIGAGIKYLIGGDTPTYVYLTQASDCVLLGYNIQLPADDTSNQIVIGSEGRGNGTNTTTIGNTSTTKTYVHGIYSNGISGASRAVVVDSNGQLGYAV
jgi:hypothetical protein